MDATLTQILPTVQARVLERGISIPEWRATDDERRRFSAAVAQTIVELRLDRQNGHSLTNVAAVADQLAGMMTGIGVLNPLLDDEATDEIIVRNGHVLRERHGALEDLGRMADDAHFGLVADRVADQGQRVMTGQRPYVLVDLPNGDRFTALKPPLSIAGTAINIRHFNRHVLSLDDMAQRGAFASDQPADNGTPDKAASERFHRLPPVARLLAHVASRNLASVLVSGEFGAGKTTLLSALSHYVPPRVQVAVVESFAELKIAHPHPLRVVVPERDHRADRDAPTMDEVLNVVITRMRPDLLIIGEIVRDEAGRFLDAINLGKRAWATIHGNDCLGALYRLETKALSSGLPHRAIREQIAAGVNLIVHLRRDPDTGRRYVAQVAHVRPQLIDGRYNLDVIWEAARGAEDELERLIQDQEMSA
jgi:pilus assembly protein CpaF